ncbi:hypothetical protein B7711_05940 [Streptococcus oralis subsp. oralis]|uniref:Uncharacterized protein n=1 Tax=Streptococcus oralis subsp. oralis TaxID=1891914 RepID=A0ABD6RIV7_STROR|nr:hypothetical protein B7711_05940 [Streptococcus oralis subsp. oralis]
MNFIIICNIMLVCLLLVSIIKLEYLKRLLTRYIVDNRSSELSFIESSDFSVLECAKILNKKYQIGLINSYIVVNSIKVR